MFQTEHENIRHHGQSSKRLGFAFFMLKNPRYLKRESLILKTLIILEVYLYIIICGSVTETPIDL